MASLLSGMRLTADRLRVPSAEVEDTVSTTITSTTFTDAASGVFSTSLTVPFSGAVWVSLRSTQRNSGALTNTITHFKADGSVSGAVYGASTVAALIVGNTTNYSLSLRKRLSGLVVGEIITVTMQHRVSSASTGTLDYRYIAIEGAPAP